MIPARRRDGAAPSSKKPASRRGTGPSGSAPGLRLHAGRPSGFSPVVRPALLSTGKPHERYPCIDRDVAGGQIARPGAGACPALPEVDRDRDLRLLERALRRLLGEPDRNRLQDDDVPEGDRDARRIDRGAGAPRRGDDPSPVRVRAVNAAVRTRAEPAIVRATRSAASSGGGAADVDRDELLSRLRRRARPWSPARSEPR